MDQRGEVADLSAPGDVEGLEAALGAVVFQLAYVDRRAEDDCRFVVREI